MLLSSVLKISAFSPTFFYSLIFEKLTNGWLRCWIPNSGVACSKPLSGSMVDSAFHPSEIDQMTTRNFWGLIIKNKLSPYSGSVAFVQFNPIHKKGS